LCYAIAYTTTEIDTARQLVILPDDYQNLQDGIWPEPSLFNNLGHEAVYQHRFYPLSDDILMTQLPVRILLCSNRLSDLIRVFRVVLPISPTSCTSEFGHTSNSCE
jgi:hypothetical protein